MSSPTKQAGTDRSQSERRTRAAEPASAAANGEGPVVEHRGVVTSMVDALEDILKWERASERAIRVAAEAQPSPTVLEPAPSN